MIENIYIIAGQAKGAVIGACTGVVHETYIVVKKGNRTATFANFFVAVIVSAFVGYFSHDGLMQAGVTGAFLVLLTMVLSLNSFLVLQLLTNLSFLIGVLKINIPNLKLPKEEIEKYENLKKENDNKWIYWGF